MKPDVDKIARELVAYIASGAEHGSWEVAEVAVKLREAYASGYRAGQERMRSRYNCTGATYSMPIEEPPT